MGVYQWVLPRDMGIDTGVLPDFGAATVNELHFADDRGKYWLSIDSVGRWTVYAGYAWDGCSPKFRLLGGMVLGTPDGALNPTTGYAQAYIPSLLHDAGYQFLDAPYFPYTRAQVDAIFYQLLKENGFYPARLYYWAVRVFGGMFRKL